MCGREKSLILLKTLNLRGEWRGLTVSVEDCYSKGPSGANHFFFLTKKATQSEGQCEAEAKNETQSESEEHVKRSTTIGREGT